MMPSNISSSEELFPIDMSGISDEAVFIYTWAVYSSLCQFINLFGIVTNIINIICFVKQGFQDTISVTLLGLSISDLGCLVTLSLTNVCFTPAVNSADLNFEPKEVNYLIIVMPHLTFARISSWITAIITMERCLCVAAPLKIKSLFTTRRAAMTVSFIFISFFCCSSPVYSVNRLDMKFSPFRNKTILGLIFLENKQDVEKIYFIINSFLMPFLALGIIVICTVTLVVQLEKTTEWRLKSATKLQAEKFSNRNEKVAKMVVMISILFIACFVPLSVSMLALAFTPELSFNGRYVKVGLMLGGIGFLMESINSSVNIFIYYEMSSKYRATLNEIIGKIKVHE